LRIVRINQNLVIYYPLIIIGIIFENFSSF